MAQDLILTPWGLDGDIARAKPNTNLAPDVIPFAAPNSTQQQKAPATLTPQMMDSILEGARKKAASSVADPYASKFQDASLSERYEGRNVFYGDYKLDPKILDARYSKQQSWWEQSANNLKVGAANGGAMFASGMLALPDILRNLANGTPITESPLEKSLYNWREEIANNNVTFQNEQDNKTDAWNTIKNTLLPSFVTGSTTGWGSVFENMMYGVGAGAALVVQEALVSAIAPGVGNSAVLAGNVAKILNNVNNIRKYSQLADRIIDTSVTLGNIAKQLNNGNRLVDAAKWGYRASIGSYGEAAFEAEEAEHTLKQHLTEQYKNTNGFAPTGADAENINKLAAEGKATRFWGNMTLLMGTNSFQLKRLFRGIDLAKESAENLAKQGLKIELNELGEAQAKKAFELKSDWWNKGFQSKLKPIVETVVSRTPKDFLLESGSEGFEEFTQDWISKGVNNYYSWKLDHRGQAGIDQAVKSMKEAFGESWNTEGLKAFLSGAVAGVAQQAIFSVPGAKRNWELGKANKVELENTLKSYNNFDVNDFFKFSNVNSVRGSVTSKAESLNAASVIDDVAQIAEDTNDKKLYKDLEAINFFNLSEPYVERGHSQILKDQFAFSLENMSDEQVQDIFGNPNITKTGAIAEFNNKVEDINDSYSKIKTAFRNPYSVGHPNYEIFESKFIPQLAYLDYRTKDLMSRKDDIQSTLGEYYNEFKYFAELKDLDKGEGYIKEELKRFNDVAEYLKTLAHEGFIEEEFNKNKHLINTYTQALKEINDFRKDSTYENYNKFLDTYHEGFVSKLERNERGFFNKDEVMGKLTDFGRITSDLQGVEDMLKMYLGTNGEQAFMSEYRFDAVRELRKRELYNLNQKLIDHAPKLKEEFPQLSDAQIEDILLNSSNTEQATAKAREAAAKEDEKNAKINELKTKIRDKFIAEGRGDVVEDFLNTADFSDEKALLQKADDYIKLINNKEFGDFKQTKHNEFLASIAKLSPNFKGTGYLEEEENQNVYDALGREGKIKYHEALIKYHQELKTFKNLPKEYIRKQNIFIKEQQDAIKALPAEDDTEQVGEYNIVKDGDGYVLSLGENIIGTYPTLKDAKDVIANIEKEVEVTTDVKAENIANLENKFENGYFDPNTYDKNGNRIVTVEQAIKNRSIKAPLYNSIAANKSEDQIAELITQNIVIDKYEVEDNDKIIGKLDEPVLRSGTTDAIVVSYMDGENKIPLNTYKNYKKGLGFMPSNVLESIFSKLITPQEENAGEAILAKLGYKEKNRQSNGNIKGGQSGWKIRFNIKNPKTGNSYYNDGKNNFVDAEYHKRAETLTKFLVQYFGNTVQSQNGNIESHYIATDKNGKKYEPFKHLSGGEIGESDFTIYTGSAEDTLKFIEDVRKHPEIMELLHAGNTSGDVKIDNIFKGRIEGSSIGFSGYHVPTNLNKVIGKDDYTFTYKGKTITVNYTGSNLSDIGIYIKETNKYYKGVFDDNMKLEFPELYENLRNVIGFNMYGTYLRGSKNQFGKLTGVELTDSPKQELTTKSVIDFIGNNSYYEFLQKSLTDPKVFNFLQNNNLIGFKGNIQDQINLIEEKNAMWEKLNTSSLEDVKRDVIFQREFTGIQYKDLGTHNITDVVYPFALLKDKDGKRYNRYVFFHVKETFKPGQTPNVEFVGLAPDFHEEALEKITASFTKRFKDGETDLYNGYYTLLSDSSGNAATYKLKARELSPVDVLYSIQNGDYSGIRIESNNPRFDVSLTVKDGDLRINIGDTNDDSVLSFDYEIKTEKDVTNLIKRIYKELKHPQNWGGITNKKSIDPKKLIFHITSKSNRTPTSVEEIIENRQIVGINPVNYRVNKLVPKLRNVTSPQVTLLAPPVPKPVPKPQAPSVSTTKTSDVAKRFLGDQMYKFPNTITFDQIDELVESFPNLQINKDKIREIVVLASYLRSVKEDVPVYLNDVSKINIKNLEKLATLPINKMSNALNNADVINLVTTSIPYKTNISNSTTENRVQALIKNCFR